MHDASEAYLGDMPHPLKHRSPLGAAFKEAEDHLEEVIRERFGIKPDVPEIKRADRALLATERRVFSGENWHWPELDGVEPLDLELTASHPRRRRTCSRAATPSSPPAASAADLLALLRARVRPRDQGAHVLGQRAVAVVLLPHPSSASTRTV